MPTINHTRRRWRVHHRPIKISNCRRQLMLSTRSSTTVTFIRLSKLTKVPIRSSSQIQSTRTQIASWNHIRFLLFLTLITTIRYSGMNFRIMWALSWMAITALSLLMGLQDREKPIQFSDPIKRVIPIQEESAISRSITFWMRRIVYGKRREPKFLSNWVSSKFIMKMWEIFWWVLIPSISTWCRTGKETPQ